MRALLVCAAPQHDDPLLVARLAESSDLVVSVDGGAALCRRAGVVPRLAVGDFDSLSPKEFDHLLMTGVEMLKYEPHKDETDLGLALQEVRARGATTVTVTASYSGRLDHSLAAVGLLLRARDLCPEIQEPGLRGWILAADARSTLELRGAGATVSVVSLRDGSRVRVEGARWSGGSIELDLLDSRGVSNIVDAEPMRVAVTRGAVLVLSPADESGRMATQLDN